MLHRNLTGNRAKVSVIMAFENDISQNVGLVGLIDLVPVTRTARDCENFDKGLRSGKTIHRLLCRYYLITVLLVDFIRENRIFRKLQILHSKKREYKGKINK